MFCRFSVALLALIVGACGGSGNSGTSGGGDDDGTGNPDSVLDGQNRRALALSGLHTHDALFFVAGPLSEELRLLLDDPGQACPVKGTVTIDNTGEMVTYQFADCALRLEPAVVVNGALVLRGTDLSSHDARTDMEFTDLQLRNDAISVRIDGELARVGEGARVSLEGTADISIDAVADTGRTVSVNALELLLDQSRLVVSRELEYQAAVVFDQRQWQFTASGTVQGGSAGCPLSGRWDFEVKDSGLVSVAGAEGGNLLLAAGDTNSTLACTELALLADRQVVTPPRPPGN